MSGERPSYTPGGLGAYTENGNGDPEDADDLGDEEREEVAIEKAFKQLESLPASAHTLFEDRGESAYNSIVSRHQAWLMHDREVEEFAKVRLLSSPHL